MCAELSTFSFPNTIHFGPGAREKLGSVGADSGKHALVVTDRGVQGLGFFDELISLLKKCGRGVTVFADVEGNPTTKHVNAGAEVYRAAKCDFVVGVGGGSPLDAAKAIALKASHPGEVTDYDDLLDGWARIDDTVPPIIAIPTTAGTGSEVGRSAVITNPDTHTKTVVFSPHLLARVAIIDAELFVGLPPYLTAATGMDALSHNVEAFLAKGFHPICDGIALEAIQMIAEALPVAVSDGSNLQARGQMALASAMGAIAFQKGLGATHSLAHPLSTLANMQHGLANAIFLHLVMAFNSEVVEQRLARIGLVLGAEGDLTRLASSAIEAVADLAHGAGLPQTLTEALALDPDAPELTDDLMDQLVQQAVSDACHMSNPRPVTADDFRQLYRLAG